MCLCYYSCNITHVTIGVSQIFVCHRDEALWQLATVILETGIVKLEIGKSFLVYFSISCDLGWNIESQTSILQMLSSPGHGKVSL